MAKRPKLPSPDELWGRKDIRPVEAFEQNVINNDPGLAAASADTGDFRLDPDPAAPTTLTLTTTSTTNPMRPRTLAAGYNAKSKILTVVFRDGTWWNYYDVPEDLWEGFRQADSKGRFLQSSGLDNWGSMGPANMSGFTQTQKAALSSLADRAQTKQRATEGAQEENTSLGRQFNP